MGRHRTVLAAAHQTRTNPRPSEEFFCKSRNNISNSPYNVIYFNYKFVELRYNLKSKIWYFTILFLNRLYKF